MKQLCFIETIVDLW